MTAPSQAGSVTTFGNSSGATQTIAMPTCAIGDLLVINFYKENNTAATFSGGSGGAWTTLAANNGASYRQTIAYRLAASGDSGATITITCAGANWRSVTGSAWTGVSGTTPVESTSGSITTSAGSTTPSASTVTPSDTDCLLLWLEADFDGALDNVTPPTGYTEPANGDFANTELSYKVAGSTSATGSVAGTITSVSTANSAALLVLKPAVPAGGATDPFPSGRRPLLVSQSTPLMPIMVQ